MSNIATHWTINGTDLDFHDADPESLVLLNNEGHFPLLALPNTYVDHLIIGSETLYEYIARIKGE